MNFSKKLLLSFLAGIAIACGGLIFLLIKSLDSSSIVSIIASYSFSVGLLLVLFFGLWLFTGKIGYVFEGKFSIFDYLIMFLGNFVGAMLIGYLAYFILKNTSIYELNYISTFDKTEGFKFWNLLQSGIFCGMFVYGAVEAFKIKKLHVSIRIILVVALIGTFVVLKLNHCIANIFYFSFANLWSWKGLLFIFVNTLANSIGAIILNSLKLLVLKFVHKS